ncbi:alliin lyase [Trifolium pratense]|uniref:Alliin lyase n=1 Tax=Trifolium pratense TaxID=57577 RepID=A0A2K3NY77_TRIPR|nr:alliin lyase [Trifolium pratense]
MVVANSSSPSDSINNNCFPCSNDTMSLSNLSNNSIIDAQKGDPLAFGSYWKQMSDECTVVIKGWELMSYYSDSSNMCWFMLPELRDEIERLHHLVGNAVTKDKYIVVGNGSSQLFQAALFAVSPSDVSDHPINVVVTAPYYSEYKNAINVLHSRMFRWAGDAALYDENKPYIEVVTSPNNPDGTLRVPMVNSLAEGKLIHDLAYYWPQYTPINYEAGHDIMLFTFSKCTGHAGSRIGWAIVKDIAVAKKMATFVQSSTMGVSKESQTRAAKIIAVICDGYQNFKSNESELFFEYSKRLMRERWEKFRGAIEQSMVFNVTKYPRAHCFAWLKCEEGIENSHHCLRKLNICGREGERFGVDSKYVRISMLGIDDEFNEMVKRLSNAKKE